ncbi:hypothetical protein IQ266_09465 [filamentous cyanobacterium LEGE 11480]|uniref:Uncharacterized protein n=1 Tax=Romeriopsis navalis LEGE 11480 TaxID=2777977 RepID=A0A928VPW8_9CYAN|nr:hypothetical protein [Romeriopsis navalis]MBE9029954.1 hypothetical protein [Romeriopsis navalis LEGE 11480]
MNRRSPRILKAMATGAFATLVGLISFTLIGCIAWPIIRGPRGLLIALIIGGLTALLIRRQTTWPASIFAGMIGSFMASYATLSMGEVLSPGSLTWAIQGGAYGAAIGTPIGSILGLIGLLRPAQK